MSKKTSPQARSARAPRPAARPVKSARGRSGGRVAAPVAAPQVPVEEGWKGWARRFVLPILLVNVIVVTLVTAVALVALLATGSTFIALPATIAQGTLIAHGAPVASATATLGAVPLMPALITLALVARRVHVIVGRRITLRQVGILAGATLAIPALVLIIAWLVLIDAATVLPVAAPPLGVALGRVLLLHTIAFAAGGGRRLWNALAKKCSIPQTIIGGIAIAWNTLVFSAGAWIIVGLINMARHSDDLRGLWEAFPGLGGRAGLVALSLGYVPNMGVVGVGLGAGGFATVGSGTFALDAPAQLNSPLPPLPLFAALPHEGTSWAEYAALGLLFLVALVASLRAPRTVTTLMSMFVELGSGIVATVIGWLVMTFFVSGAVGNAGEVALYPFSPAVMLVACFAFGYVTAWAVRDMRYQRTRRRAAQEQEHASAHVGQQHPASAAAAQPQADEAAAAEAFVPEDEGEDSSAGAGTADEDAAAEPDAVDAEHVGGEDAATTATAATESPAADADSDRATDADADANADADAHANEAAAGEDARDERDDETAAGDATPADTAVADTAPDKSANSADDTGAEEPAQKNPTPATDNASDGQVGEEETTTDAAADVDSPADQGQPQPNTTHAGTAEDLARAADSEDVRGAQPTTDASRAQRTEDE